MLTTAQYKVLSAACTDVGRVREHNEDSFLIANLTEGIRRESNGELDFPSGPDGCLLAVADGMGGAAAGEMASRLGVQILYRELQELIPIRADSNEETLEEILVEAVGMANRRIFQLSRQNHELHGMGTTLTAVLELNGSLTVGQIGDSRAYLLREDGIYQVTRDQSLVAHMVVAGKLTEEEARHHPERNVLLQALGVRDTVELALQRVPVRPGDLVMLCSDGLHGLMSADEIYQTASRAHGLEEAARRLVDLANSRGGPDNITVVMAQFLPTRSRPRRWEGREDDESGLFDFSSEPSPQGFFR